jgi:hypothetical protein
MVNFYYANIKIEYAMPISSSEHDGIYRLKYCSICDASPYGGDNPFLYALGSLQRKGRVDLVLGFCIICKGIVWQIKFVLE